MNNINRKVNKNEKINVSSADVANWGYWMFKIFRKKIIWGKN